MESENLEFLISQIEKNPSLLDELSLNELEQVATCLLTKISKLRKKI